MKPILESLGLITLGTVRAWAVTSPCGQYRYILGRMWDDYFDDGREWWDREPARPLWCFGMLNPSKARHDVDDPTIRKCTGFAERGGAGGFVVVNTLAFSATHPTDMVTAHRNGIDVCGKHNEAAIQWATSRPAVIGRNIAAWGRIPPKLKDLTQRGITAFLSPSADCLGVNADGSPRHPLMLRYDTPILRLADARPV